TQREGPMGGQFHDQPLGQRLRRAVVVIVGLFRTDRLTTRSDDGAASRGRQRFPAGTTNITPLPHRIYSITILDRGLFARLILGPDITAIDRKAAVPIQRDEDTRARDLARIVDQRPLLERLHRRLELTEPVIDLLRVFVLTGVLLLQR